MAVRKITYDEYAAMPDDGNRYELIDGELIELSSPSDLHQLVLLRLVVALADWQRTTRLGRLRFAPLDVILDLHNCLQPDILYVANERRSIMHSEGLRGAPTLAVEILSPSTARRDLRTKRALYGEFGVEEYWVVDAEAERVEIYEAPFGQPRFVESPDVLRSPRLAGFELALGELFAPED